MYAQLKSGVQGLGFRGDGGNNCKYHFTTMDIYIYIFVSLWGGYHAMLFAGTFDTQSLQKLKLRIDTKPLVKTNVFVRT